MKPTERQNDDKPMFTSGTLVTPRLANVTLWLAAALLLAVVAILLGVCWLMQPAPLPTTAADDAAESIRRASLGIQQAQRAPPDARVQPSKQTPLVEPRKEP
jgi:hypothetical protein